MGWSQVPAPIWMKLEKCLESRRFALLAWERDSPARGEVNRIIAVIISKLPVGNVGIGPSKP